MIILLNLPVYVAKWILNSARKDGTIMADKLTYYEKQLNDILGGVPPEYPLAIKIVNDQLHTKWMDLNEESISAIMRFLQKLKTLLPDTDKNPSPTETEWLELRKDWLPDLEELISSLKKLQSENYPGSTTKLRRAVVDLEEFTKIGTPRDGTVLYINEKKLDRDKICQIRNYLDKKEKELPKHGKGQTEIWPDKEG